jgi:amino acid transporter
VIGLSLGKVVINSFTVAKCTLVIFMIIAGFSAWRVNVFNSEHEFFPDGVEGTLKGTSLLFFGFIGFDEVCCLASRSDNPAHTMPRAIAGTLFGATVMSVLAQLALGGMVKRYDDDDSITSFEDAFGDIGWSWAKWITAIGEVLLLPLVVLVSFLPQPELFAALAEDGVIPIRFAKANKQGTLVYGTLVGGFIMTVCSCMVPFVVLWDMINLGVLLGFNLTNTSLIVLRYGLSGDFTDSSSTALIGQDNDDYENKDDHDNHSSQHGRIIPQQPSWHTTMVKQCVAGLWIFGILGAYCFWIGYAAPSLEHRPHSDSFLPLTIVGTVSLVLFALSVIRLKKYGIVEVEKLPINTFRASGVPFIPAFAILCNFFLMAQYDAWTHAYLGFFILASMIGYLWYRFSK